MRHRIWILVGIVAIAAVVYFETGRAQAPQAADPADLAEGMRLYQQKADCRACHGWAADGVKSDNQMPDGPSLRDKKYTRAAAGPDDQMRAARTRRCLRSTSSRTATAAVSCMTAADLTKHPTRMPDPPATLQQREIELIADFLMAKVVGQGPDGPRQVRRVLGQRCGRLQGPEE